MLVPPDHEEATRESAPEPGRKQRVHPALITATALQTVGHPSPGLEFLSIAVWQEIGTRLCSQFSQKMPRALCEIPAKLTKARGQTSLAARRRRDVPMSATSA